MRTVFKKKFSSNGNCRRVNFLKFSQHYTDVWYPLKIMKYIQQIFIIMKFSVELFCCFSPLYTRKQGIESKQYNGSDLRYTSFWNFEFLVSANRRELFCRSRNELWFEEFLFLIRTAFRVEFEWNFQVLIRLFSTEIILSCSNRDMVR